MMWDIVRPRVHLNTANMGKEIEEAGKKMLAIVKARAAVAALGRALGGGLRPMLAAAKRGVPKKRRKTKKRKWFEPRTGLLKKSLVVKHGVTKKGAPFAIVGPSRKTNKDIARGPGKDGPPKPVNKRPSNYAHLVEYGFMAKARKAGQLGREKSKTTKTSRRIASVRRMINVAGFKIAGAVARGVSRGVGALAPVGNLLTGGMDRILGSWYDVSQKRRKKFFKKAGLITAAVKGFAGRLAKRAAGGRTLVKGTNFIDRANRSSKGEVADATVKKLESEMKKLIESVAGKARRKAEKAATL